MQNHIRQQRSQERAGDMTEQLPPPLRYLHTMGTLAQAIERLGRKVIAFAGPEWSNRAVEAKAELTPEIERLLLATRITLDVCRTPSVTYDQIQNLTKALESCKRIAAPQDLLCAAQMLDQILRHTYAEIGIHSLQTLIDWAQGAETAPGEDLNSACSDPEEIIDKAVDQLTGETREGPPQLDRPHPPDCAGDDDQETLISGADLAQTRADIRDSIKTAQLPPPLWYMPRLATLARDIESLRHKVHALPSSPAPQRAEAFSALVPLILHTEAALHETIDDLGEPSTVTQKQLVTLANVIEICGGMSQSDPRLDIMLLQLSLTLEHTYNGIGVHFIDRLSAMD